VTRVLVVEDEESYSDALAYMLRKEGFEVGIAGTGPEAIAEFERAGADIVLLDLMLPGMPGTEVCRVIRQSSNVPVIMVSAKDSEVDKVVGLELGADDYVVKPFSAAELIARIRAIQRRGRGGASRRGPIEIGDLSLDLAARIVTKDGRTVELAAKEFDLLRMLMSRAGEVVGREEIMDEVWDPHWFGPTKTLDVHISWLRRKIEDDPSSPRYITTVRGVGFRFMGPDADIGA